MSRLIHKARRDCFVVFDSLSEAKGRTENQFSHIRLRYALVYTYDNEDVWYVFFWRGFID
jgi:hypothetical protein